MTRCRGCGKEIDFVRTRNGAAVPVNPAPVRWLFCDGKPAPGRPWARGYTREGDSIVVYTKDDDDGEIPAWKPCRVIRITHFTDCPNRDQFKKRKASE